MTQTDPDEFPKRATVPTITEAADLLALLNEAPRRRAVTYRHFVDHAPRPGVSEYPDERIEGLGRTLAVIEAGSADDLLHYAVDVDVRRDLEAWAACPIRYRSTKSTTALVSPDHPAAPGRPGDSF